MMNGVIFQAHSGLRYLVLLAALLALVFVLDNRFSGGMEKGRRIALKAFAGLLDLQVLLGIALLFVRPFYGALAGHITMMVLALVAVHVLLVRARRATDPQRSFVLMLLGIILPLVFIVGGIMAIGRPVF